jgi:hypothetical protein
MKQLKQLKFKQEILINVYRSLTLSHYTYSAPFLISTSANRKNEMTKQQHRFLNIIGITPQQAYDKHNILPIEILIEKSCTNIVQRILKDETHPLTQAQISQPQPKYSTRNSQTRITKAKTAAYENSCLQIVLKMKRDGFREKYIKPKRKEATTVEYNLAVQAQKKQKRPQQTKRLQNNNKAIQEDTTETECPICKLQFKKRGIKQHKTKIHKKNKSDQ